MSRLTEKHQSKPPFAGSPAQKRADPLSVVNDIAAEAARTLDLSELLDVALKHMLALTGMEASLRFGGAETCDSKIFGRLSAWQNWIFIRPNATGKDGALTRYGQPEPARFDWRRT